MKVGDKVKAEWSDGLVYDGTYVGSRRGYIIIVDEDEKQIVCNKDNVEFTVLKEAEE
jgi:hypothetical protein